MNMLMLSQTFNRQYAVKLALVSLCCGVSMRSSPLPNYSLMVKITVSCKTATTKSGFISESNPWISLIHPLPRTTYVLPCSIWLFPVFLPYIPQSSFHLKGELDALPQSWINQCRMTLGSLSGCR